VVKKSACPSAAALESFHTELRIFERLNDTGLTPHVYGGFVCSHADDAARFPVPWSYLFLERMDGNLTEWVERTGTLPVDVVVRVFELVQRMHTHGVIHRDLHLSNVLYRHGAQADPHLFLTDFGNSYEIRRVRDSDEMVPRRNNFLFGAPEATVRDAMLYDYYTVVKSLAMMGFDVHCRHPLIDGSTHITERFPTRRTFDVAFVVNDQSHEERVESDSVLDAARQAFERRPSASLVVIGAKMFTEKPFVGHAIALDFDFERAVDRSLRALHTLRTLHADRP
jgi:serine/threonine protein kinase